MRDLLVNVSLIYNTSLVLAISDIFKQEIEYKMITFPVIWKKNIFSRKIPFN